MVCCYLFRIEMTRKLAMFLMLLNLCFAVVAGPTDTELVRSTYARVRALDDAYEADVAKFVKAIAATNTAAVNAAIARMAATRERTRTMTPPPLQTASADAYLTTAIGHHKQAVVARGAIMQFMVAGKFYDAASLRPAAEKFSEQSIGYFRLAFDAVGLPRP
jgi:hypothetical protein